MRKPPITLLLSLIIFSALSGHQLRLPGLHNDEAQEAGLPALQLVGGGSVTAFRHVGLGSRQYPLMVQDYIGAINVYLVAPFVFILGPSVASVRLPSLLVGAATLLATFGFMSAVWGKRAASFAAGLLAINPSFVFWNRQGILIASLTLTLAVALMWVGFHWSRRGGWKLTLLAGFLAGTGVYSKLLFVWVILGLAGTVMVFNIPVLFQARCTIWPRRPTPQEVAAATIGLLLGLLPLLVYNLVTGGTLLAGRVAVVGSEYGALANVAGRIDHFRAVLAGRDHLWYLGGSAANMLWEWALVLSAFLILLRVIMRRPGSRSALALALTLFLGLLQVPFTPTAAGLFPHHFAVFAPMWIMLVAVAFDSGFSSDWSWTRVNRDGQTVDLGEARGNSREHHPRFGGRHGFLAVLRMALFGIGLVALAGKDMQVDLYYHSVLRESGGESQYSDAIYRLVDELESRQGSTIVALDWGFAPQLRYLTGERIVPHEIFGYSQEVDQGFVDRVERLLATPDTVFVAHWPNETFFPRRQAFEQVAAATGFDVERQAIIARRTGAPMFELLSVTRN